MKKLREEKKKRNEERLKIRQKKQLEEDLKKKFEGMSPEEI